MSIRALSGWYTSPHAPHRLRHIPDTYPIHTRHIPDTYVYPMNTLRIPCVYPMNTPPKRPLWEKWNFLPLWLFCARRWLAVCSTHLFVWLDNCHSGTLTARRTIDCERNIVSIVVLPLPFGCSFVRVKNYFAEYTILVLYNSTQKKYQFFRKTYHTLLIVPARVIKFAHFISFY